MRWHRRSIAAVTAFVAVFAGVSAASPPRTPTVTVVAAGRDLSGGTTLAASDLVRISLPTDAAPDGAESDPVALVGRTLNAPVTARSVVTRASVSTGVALARPGHVVFAITLPNPALASLIEAGTHLDVIAANKGATIASDVRVVAAPEPETSMLSGSGQRLLLVEVTPDTAAKLAAAAEAGGLTVAVR